MSKLYRPNRIVILGIDTFRHKNISQIELMNKQGFIFDVFTNDSLNDSPQQFKCLEQLNRLFKLKNSFLSRVKQLFLYFWQYKKLVHHAEIYPAGRFSFFYSILCKCLRIKIIVVERGDLKDLIKTPVICKAIDSFVYNSAKIVWYKEPYMEPLLKGIGVKHCRMVANAVAIPTIQNSEFKNIDFLWANRVIPLRNFDWFVSYLHDKIKFRIVAIGYLPKYATYLSADIHKLLNGLKGKDHFNVHGYVEPRSFYERAKFFVLPSPFIYGNYALLEAMSYGLVPIVSETEVTNKIVQDNVNGITFKHEYESFVAAIERAMNMDESTYQLLSSRARKTIQDDFSLAQWTAEMNLIYSEVDLI